ncbi:hypothetical protein Tco_0436223 [Tanacetum coccineum]
MALPNKDQLKFHSYQDEKLLMEAIKKSSETMDQTFDMLQKLISQLEIQGEVINQEDMNLKLLRSSSSTSQNSQNVAFVSNNTNNTNNTNKADNTAHGVSTTYTQVETPTQNALIAQDGIGGYDWSYQAEEEKSTNHALMAFISSGSSSSLDSEVDSYSKTYVKAYASLKEQYDNLSYDYKKSQFNLVSYKAGLESVEARLAHYNKNEAMFEESINVLKLEVRLRDNALNEYKMNLEKAEIDRDQLKQALEKFQNSSKSLNNILESQVIDKFKTGLGYDAATTSLSSALLHVLCSRNVL